MVNNADYIGWIRGEEQTNNRTGMKNAPYQEVFLVLEVAMVKKFFLIMVLLAGTAFTVLFGEAFDFSVIVGTSTATTAVATATEQATATVEYTATEEPTATEQITQTLEATSTPEATATPEEETATATPTSTATNTPLTPTNTITPTEAYNELFEVQTGSPVYMTNFVHPDAGCNWQGVAGQVFSSNGSPLVGYVARLTGTYNGVTVNMLGLTGLVENEPYGPGSFEFVVGTTALDSQDMLYIQLFDATGIEVTAPVALTTYSSCSKNLQIINFVAK